jgi:poly-gamma-glutamate synthesis protein (capsule biosynthesis protein)
MLLLFTCRLKAQDIKTGEIPRAESFGRIVREDTLTIRFFGDLMMHSQQISTAESHSGEHCFDTYFTHIRKYLDDSDLNVGNMEFTLAGKPYSGYPAFSAPDEFAKHIAESGFDIFLTANNHICDKLSAGMARTLEVYRALGRTYGISFTGTAGSQEEFECTTPLIVECKGTRIAFINATYGTNLAGDRSWPKTNYLGSKEMLAKALKKAEEVADITIALAHWGEEYQLRHSKRQKETAKYLADNGADIIIGSHPHVAQDCGIIETEGHMGIPVAYSLGNLISNMSAPDTQIGLMATVKIVRRLNGSVFALPMEFTYLWTSRPGGYYSNSYTIIPVKHGMAHPEEWHGKWEYDKMCATFARVAETTGIQEH